VSAQDGEADRAVRRIESVGLIALESALGTCMGVPGGPLLTELRLLQRGHWLVMLRAHTDRQHYVAWVEGNTPLRALANAGQRIRRGTVEWRIDAYARNAPTMEEQGRWFRVQHALRPRNAPPEAPGEAAGG
jgi:hypothetical protein